MRDITLIFGCMFSGKTTKLIELFGYSNSENEEKLAIKPILDTRYSAHNLHSHNGLQLPSHRLSKPEELYPLISDKTKELYIDEVQFFSESIIQVLLDLSIQGVKIIAAGLDKDYLGKDFGPMPGLKKLANNHIFLKARCAVCNEKAEFTYRKVEFADLIVLGHGDIYEARCETHWLAGMNP